MRGKDSNQRPPGYEPDELPAALPRDIYSYGSFLRIPHMNERVKQNMGNASQILFGKFGKEWELLQNPLITFRKMGEKTGGTVFDPVFQIAESASATGTESVKRTVAEKTVELFLADSFMTGKIRAVPVAEKTGGVFTHRMSSQSRMAWTGPRSWPRIMEPVRRNSSAFPLVKNDSFPVPPVNLFSRSDFASAFAPQAEAERIVISLPIKSRIAGSMIP